MKSVETRARNFDSVAQVVADAGEVLGLSLAPEDVVLAFGYLEDADHGSRDLLGDSWVILGL